MAVVESLCDLIRERGRSSAFDAGIITPPEITLSDGANVCAYDCRMQMNLRDAARVTAEPYEGERRDVECRRYKGRSHSSGQRKQHAIIDPLVKSPR